MVRVIYFFNGRNQEIEEYYLEKEYRDDIVVELNGMFYELYFFTQDSLEYEMTKEGYFSFPGLVILETVSTEKIRIAILNLEKKGYFNRLNGMKELSQEKRFIHNWYINELPLFDSNKLVIEEF
jgi:hypothetical protein